MVCGCECHSYIFELVVYNTIDMVNIFWQVKFFFDEGVSRIVSLKTNEKCNG